MYAPPTLNSNEYRVPFPIHVGVSKIQFCPEAGSSLLAVSAWDGTVRVYDVAFHGDIKDRGVYYHGKPALCCTFVDGGTVASGAADYNVKIFDIASTKNSVLGCHNDTVRCIETNKRMGFIASGGWDHMVKLWDPRTGGGEQQSCNVKEKVYGMDTKNNRLVVANRNRDVLIYDVRSLREPEQIRECPLKYQVRCVSLFPDANAFVLSSIEGRVAVEYVDPSENAKKYAFKCHRTKDAGDGSELIYPVNALAFHPYFNTFATGGSDAIVNLWDPLNRKRLVQLHKFDTTIASLSFNADGNLLAIASSYSFEAETDPMPMPDNSITIRRVAESECRPRQ